jgi:signal transducing adaptor molecule
MEEWTQMFASNPDFGIMEQAYMKLKTTSMYQSLLQFDD